MKNLILVVLGLGFFFNSYSQQENKKSKVMVFDKNLRSNGIPLFAPVFKIEDSKVTFSSGGDLRNTNLDFSKAKVEALCIAEILSDLGSFSGSDDSHYVLCVKVDTVDRRMFIDQNWVYYPGKTRKINIEGPFASFDIECVKGNEPVKGVKLELNGIKVQTDDKGNSSFDLKGIKNKILTLIIIDPQSTKHFKKIIAVPIVCARPDFAFYSAIRIDLLKLQ